MTFWSHRIVYNIVSVNSGFCLRVVLSTWESSHLDVCLFDSVHFRVKPHNILPT